VTARSRLWQSKALRGGMPWGDQRIVRTVVLFGETSLRNAVCEFLSHYHGERNHQGLGNRIIAPGREVGRVSVEVGCRDRLGGLLRYYRYHEAA